MVKITVDGSRQALTFSACHIIQGHTKCGRMHGHNYSVSVSLEGDVEHGLLMDFGPLKKAIRDLCNELDHRVLLPKSLVTVADGQTDMIVSGKIYSFPSGDVILLPVDVVSTERLSEWFLERIVSDVELPAGVHRVEVRVDEADGQGAITGQNL